MWDVRPGHDPLADDAVLEPGHGSGDVKHRPEVKGLVLNIQLADSVTMA